MRKISAVFFAFFVSVALHAQMPRSEWHAKVGECALDPVTFKATIAQVSSSDKAALLAEVNEAISKMPGSSEVKAAQFLVANRAAVAGAGPADRAAVLSEMFATVPPEALAVINEEFAKNEFSRTASMTDGHFTNIVAVAMSKIVQRCSSAESGAVRAAFAGLMFVRAAGTAADSALAISIAALPNESRDEASNSWYPAALGRNQASSYDPMLAASQAGEEPDHATVIGIYSQQIVESMLADLQAGVLPSGNADGTVLGNPPTDFYINGDVDAMSVKMIEPSRGRINDRLLPDSSENPFYSGGRKPSDKGDYEGGGSGGGGEPGPYWLQRL